MAETLLGGRDVIRLTGKFDRASGVEGYTEAQDALAACGISVPTTDPLAERMLAEFSGYLPNRQTGEIELSIGPDDFRVYRFKLSTDYYNGARIVQSSSETREYSLFNVAQLPGPLPQ